MYFIVFRRPHMVRGKFHKNFLTRILKICENLGLKNMRLVQKHCTVLKQISLQVVGLRKLVITGTEVSKISWSIAPGWSELEATFSGEFFFVEVQNKNVIVFKQWRKHGISGLGMFRNLVIRSCNRDFVLRDFALHVLLLGNLKNLFS